ncbi:uncharacterized protein LOC110026164 isoform X2 [Phalaenopsis equestris]|uniref:uncharacterized protein LOC110026164 isoform X2 n=1 Tax=Phalaenopsis equestris TaxID=78828 RepID=UPI0009E524F7|nr:uncharacterized protein LOC110026164 isoform X2 [Phalaenopsis equestris]
MGLALGDVLKRLCVEIGWSYAVFWRAVGLQEQRCLIWEDGYCGRMHGAISGFEAMDLLIKEKGLLRGSRCEERFTELGRSTEDRIYALVHRSMTSQVHVVGDGVVGKAVSTGRHNWILQGKLNQKFSATKDLVEINQQFLAGIQTIAVIPILPQGVLQLGSTQLIFEEIGFVNFVQHLFMQPGSMAGTNLCDGSGTILNQKPPILDITQPSSSQFGNVSSNVDGLLSHNLHEVDQLFRGHDPRFTSKTSSLFTSSLNKVPLSSQQMLLDSNISSKKMLPFCNFSQSTCHIVQPNLYSNNQLKSECLEHPGTFSASNSMISEKSLPQNLGYGNHCRSEDVNGSLFAGHLKSLENQFRTDQGTAHGSAGNHEAMVDSSSLPHLGTHESKLYDSHGCSESASSFGRSSSSNKKENIGNSCSLSSGVMKCIRSEISFESNASQIQSLTDDLDRVRMLSCGFSQTQSTSTGKISSTLFSLNKEKDENIKCQALDGSRDRLHNISKRDDWYDYHLVSANNQDPNGSVSQASVQYSVVAYNPKILPPSSIKTTFDMQQQNAENILFDPFDLDQVSNASYSLLEDSFVNLNGMEVCELSADVPACVRQVDAVIGDILNDEISCSGGLFCESGSDQLLDAIVSQMKPNRKLISDDNVSCNTASTKTSNVSLPNSSTQCNMAALSEQLAGNFVGKSPNITKLQTAGTSSFTSECSRERSEGLCSLGDEKSKSQISLWVGKARNMTCDGMSSANCKKIDDAGKLNRKRSRTGENPRPRPKDRQMIQDRVKELREIVPNGAKMSIDALLEKTIKHMLFLQSVTKHADKLKETGRPKIISEDEGLLLKDNFDGGATWAFEVGSQSVICPIVVEDLSTPRHMLVEMLCEKRGLFLEIADLIRGLGLTILKGVMEARDEKVWARFAVEYIC